MHKYQRITILLLPFFWNFTYRLQVSIFFVDSALFFLFIVGLLLGTYYLLVFIWESLWERRML